MEEFRIHISFQIIDEGSEIRLRDANENDFFPFSKVAYLKSSLSEGYTILDWHGSVSWIVKDRKSSGGS